MDFGGVRTPGEQQIRHACTAEADRAAKSFSACRSHVVLARSPISRVDDITAPMLLIHGVSDVRVARRHSDRVVDALRTLERFLARHLGGRSPSALPAWVE